MDEVLRIINNMPLQQQFTYVTYHELARFIELIKAELKNK